MARSTWSDKVDDWREDVETCYRGEFGAAIIRLFDEFQPEFPLPMCERLMALLDGVIIAHDNELAYLEAKLHKESEV